MKSSRSKKNNKYLPVLLLALVFVLSSFKKKEKPTIWNYQDDDKKKRFFEFVSEFMPSSYPDQLKKFIAVQTAFETGWGSSMYFNNNYNWAGIRSSSAPTTQHSDFINGEWVTTTMGFKKYTSFESGFEDYISLLLSPKYITNKNASFEDLANVVKSGGWATAPDYVSKLVSTYNYNSALLNSVFDA